MVQEVKGQIKKLAITSSNRKDLMFLGVDVDRQGYITRENIRKLCEKQHLPAEPQVIDAVSIYFFVLLCNNNYPNQVFLDLSTDVMILIN